MRRRRAAVSWPLPPAVASPFRQPLRLRHWRRRSPRSPGAALVRLAAVAHGWPGRRVLRRGRASVDPAASLPYVGAFDVKPPQILRPCRRRSDVAGAEASTRCGRSRWRSTRSPPRLVVLSRPPLRRSWDDRRFRRDPLPNPFPARTSNDAYSPACRADHSRLPRRAVAAELDLREPRLTGLLIGLAGAVKQTAGFEAVALLIILRGAPDGAGRRGSEALAFALGAGVAPLGFLALFRRATAPRRRSSTTHCWAR